MSSSLGLLACLATTLLPLAPQDTTPAPVPALSSLELPLSKLAEWGRREFEYRLAPDGPGFGTFVLETKVEGQTATLHDRVDLTLKGTPFWVEMTATGPLENLLRPSHLEAKGTTDDGDGKTFEFSAEITDAVAHVTTPKKTKDHDMPAGTLTSMAMYRVVTLLPRRAGFTTSYEHNMDANEMNLKAGGTITCVGEESVGTGEHATKAWRFDVTSANRVFLSAWVDDAGNLVRACIDGRKWLIAKN